MPHSAETNSEILSTPIRADNKVQESVGTGPSMQWTILCSRSSSW